MPWTGVYRGEAGEQRPFPCAFSSCFAGTARRIAIWTLVTASYSVRTES